MRRFGRRFLTILFVLVMVISMMSGGVFAAESAGPAGAGAAEDPVSSSAPTDRFDPVGAPLPSADRFDPVGAPISPADRFDPVGAPLPSADRSDPVSSPLPSATPELDVPRPYSVPLEVLADMSPLAEILLAGKMKAAATATYYRDLEQLSGSLAISGGVTRWNSSRPDIATFEQGKILAHNLGTARVTLHLSGGNTAVYNISSYWSYPQPKKSVVNHGDRLRSWAGPDNEDYTGYRVTEGETVTVLWSVAERSATGENSWIYQYVRKAGGQTGYLPAGYMDSRVMKTYYGEIPVSDVSEIFTFYESGGVDRYDTDNTWRSSDENIVETTPGRYGGYANQGIMTAGETEGTAIVTATAPGGKVLTSGFVTVFTPMVNMKGYTSRAVAVQNGAGAGCRAADFLGAGVPVDITGASGSFWRVGNHQYIAKSAVRIPVSKVTLGLGTKRLGPGDSVQATVKVLPENATDKTLIWKSSHGQIAAVDGGGLIRHLSEGSAVITATSRSDAGIGDSALLNCLATAFPKLSVSHRGFREVKLNWDYVTGVTGYQVERFNLMSGQWEVLNRVGSLASSYLDKDLVPGTGYRYRVCGYQSSGQAIVIGEYSDEIDIKTKTLTVMVSDNRAHLHWGASDEAFGYRIWQIDGKTKKTVALKKAEGAASNYLVTNLTPDTNYIYYVTPEYVEQGKVMAGGESNRVSVRTKNVTDGYFYDQIFLARNWCTIHYSNGKATTGTMDDWTVQSIKPAIKYNYAAKNNTLYIHVYYRVTGSGAGKKFEYYKPVFDKDGNVSKYQKTKTGGSTYLALAKSGILKHWTKSKIKGNAYDFKKGVVFNTKVILHQKKGKGVAGQRYVNFRIGAGAGSRMMFTDGTGAYWHYAINVRADETVDDIEKNGIRYHYYQYNYLAGNFILNLATQKQTINNPKSTNYKSAESSQANYSNVAAHELGHVLGLNDAYALKKSDNVSIVRSIDSKEVNRSIMQGKREDTVTPNDMEMMLNAQGTAAKYLQGIAGQNDPALIKSPSWQNYKTYADYTNIYIISPVIRSKK